MIKVGNGETGWWYNGHAFFSSATAALNGAERLAIQPQDREAAPLRRALIVRAFGLHRWQGECGPFGRVSVAIHSMMVGHLAGLLAEARGIDRRIGLVVGAVHDLGETLGLGDPASPWLRKWPDLRERAAQHQRCAAQLFGIYDPASLSPPLGEMSLMLTPELKKIERDADHLAAALERRFLFCDRSRDMEVPDIEALMQEAGIEKVRAAGRSFHGGRIVLPMIHVLSSRREFSASDLQPYEDLEKMILFRGPSCRL